MPRERALVLFALFGAACLACGDEREEPGTPDSGAEEAVPDSGPSPDADAPDLGAPDSGVPGDAGPPPDSGVLWSESSCAACETRCPGGACLSTQSGERFCADDCGGDPAGCIDGFTCLDIGAPMPFCVPAAASCEPPGTGFGTSCYGDITGCAPGRTHCEGDFHSLGYCTEGCAEDPDCPPGYACGPGDEDDLVCRATFVSLAERCGRANDDLEMPCAVDSDCYDTPSAVCVRSEPTLPGVCAAPCSESCGGDLDCSLTHRGRACLSERCGCHAVPDVAGRDLLGEALAQVALSRCGAIWDIYAWAPLPADILFDPYRLSFYDPIHNEPLRAPRFASGLAADLERAAGEAIAPASRAARVVERLSVLLDKPAAKSPPGVVDPIEPLAEAVAALIRETGGAADEAALVADAFDVPMDLQLALAEVVDGMRRASNRPIPASRIDDLYEYGPSFVAQRSDGLGLSPASEAVRNLINRDIDYGRMFGAAADLLDAIGAADLARFSRVPTSSVATSTAALIFNQMTPIGRIAIGGAESGVYDSRTPGFEGDWALLVDLGGNDAYRVPAGGNASSANAVSVLLDLGGADRYGYVEAPRSLDQGRLPSDEGGRYRPLLPPDRDNGPISFSDTPRQGGARAGTALLADYGPEGDEYRSLRMSQGAGVFGVGVLIDEGGDDVYEAEAFAQGAGAFGIGLLLDLGGSDPGGGDVFRAYQEAQGFGYARGAGALFNAGGDDDYLMNPGDPEHGGDPLYFSAQRPGRANSSLGQGFAFGRRADFTDGAFMSGGVGLLVDAAGDDRYAASIFAQGGGFWFGTGVLADLGGHDAYDSLWYGMGAGAHYALGLLLDRSGDDTYGGVLPRVNVTIAGGHDYSAAFLIDDGGNDVYYGSRITLGSGNVNGMGFFADNAGDDRYFALSAYGLGAAGLSENNAPGSPRRKVFSLGVFLDAGGADAYQVNEMEPAGIGDDRAWTQSQSEDPALMRVELGTAIDGAGETTLHTR